MSTFKQQFPYSSQRIPTYADNVVAASQPLAAQSGIQALQQGGNAVDAALATAITLTVVEPTMNGIGGDAFCLLWDGMQLHGLNASGRSPANMSIKDFATMPTIPDRGWHTVTTPGQVSGWVALSERFGNLPFEQLFTSAIHYAEKGFMVTPITARLWHQAATTFANNPYFQPFLPNGRAPQTGERFCFPEQAQTLEKIAVSKGESFYRGALAQKIAATAKQDGAWLSEADLDNHQADWVTPIYQSYCGHELHEIPPNGQGLAALAALGILQHLDISQYQPDSADSVHCQIEAMKLAFVDAARYIADPQCMDISTEALLSPEYLENRASLIDMRFASSVNYSVPKKSGTVYLTTADTSGMMVSYIQSNYQDFGSGIVIPGTGISLQNRGCGFTLEQGHPNQVAGNKRPFHTIIPAFLSKHGNPKMSFGVMGGHMQAQGHVQLVLRVVDYQQNPQAASDAPRWQIRRDGKIILEQGFPDCVREILIQRGHKLIENSDNARFEMGGAQLILKINTGYVGASDHRKDGLALGF